jgi:adenine-specific DNA-methyltransferase
MPPLSCRHNQHAEQAATKVPHHLLTVQSVHGDATAGNLLVQGDNLLALKTLASFYGETVNGIFIDLLQNAKRF